jgi:hypothetical protein
MLMRVLIRQFPANTQSRIFCITACYLIVKTDLYTQKWNFTLSFTWDYSLAVRIKQTAQTEGVWTQCAEQKGRS